MDRISSLLQTDARLIAENDTHVVVALRLSKAMIARNLPFLAALGDLSPAPADDEEIASN